MLRYLRALIVILAGIAWEAPAPAQEIGVVKSVAGEVIIQRADTDVEAAVGTTLRVQDRLLASADSTLGAALNDGTTLALSGPANVVLSQFVFSPGPGIFELVIRIMTGELIYRAGRIGEARPDRVQIETPQLVVGTRGTRFAVVVPPAAN